MKKEIILLMGLLSPILATRVLSEDFSSGSQAGQWNWPNQDESHEQEPHGTTNEQKLTLQDSHRQEYNTNIQSESSGVADALDQKVKSVDTVIDNILVSNRQGRNLEGYDEIYTDPDIKNALQLGNDTLARSFIRDKLCNLGLMSCDESEGRRPFYSPHRDIHPHDIIYAQPVTIRPVGRPLPAIPIKRPYGAPKPVPLPSFGSPIYPGPPPPSFSGPPLFPRPPNGGIFKPSGTIYGPKPIYEHALDTELDYEDKFIDKKQVVVHHPGGSVQQHVHHHYHHGDALKPGPPGVLPGSLIGTSPINGGGYGYGSGGTYGATFNDFEDYKKTFKVKTPSSTGNNLLGPGSNYADRYPAYEKPLDENNAKQFNPGFGLNPDLIPNNNEDCFCVPYEQCSTIDQVGRKDDLYLAIDPRNLDKGIEAETVEVVVTDGNGTMNIVRVPKNVNETDGVNGDEKNIESNDWQGRMKRDSKRADDDYEKPEEAQRKLLGSNLDPSKLNIKPTWGVSFGLPQLGGSTLGHPVNPVGVSNYPGYGIGADGISLGLVSINPLIALQVTKDDYGEKLIKPFVNLHVTPTRKLVNKLGAFFAHHKQNFFDHYGDNHAPQYYPNEFTVHHDPHLHHPNRPYYQNYHEYERPHYYSGHYRADYNSDYDENLNDYTDSYYRNTRTNGSLTKDDRNELDVKINSDFNDYKEDDGKITFPGRKKRDSRDITDNVEERQFGRPPVCGPRHVCCRRNQISHRPRHGQCGVRNTNGILGRIKTPVYVDGDSEFGEYPWQVAILKKDPSESVYVCGGTLISPQHIITAAHCIKTHAGRDLRARLGEWDVNNDVEFYPYIERDVVSVYVHPEFYAGTLYNDVAILKLDHEVDFTKNPHISTACLPDKFEDFNGQRCWTTGWGKNAFGDRGKYQNVLKEVDVPVVSNQICEHQMRRTRLGPSFNLHPGFICAGGEEGKDACKGDGGGPMVCEKQGKWQLAGVVSWGIGCGEVGVPGVYTRVSYYSDWIRQILDQ